MSVKKYHDERRIVGYAPEDYKNMISGLSIERGKSEASIVSTAVMQYFDRLSPDRKKSLLLIHQNHIEGMKLQPNISNVFITPINRKSPNDFPCQLHDDKLLRFRFSLISGWDLLLDEFADLARNKVKGAYNTQKIFGISDILGNNSVRLGLRLRSMGVNNGFKWQPILYQHIGGRIFQETFDFEPVVNTDGTVYTVEFAKIESSPYADQVGKYLASIQIDGVRPMYATSAEPIQISAGIINTCRLSGPWVECFKQNTKGEWIKKGSSVQLSTKIELLS